MKRIAARVAPILAILLLLAGAVAFRSQILAFGKEGLVGASRALPEISSRLSAVAHDPWSIIRGPTGMESALVASGTIEARVISVSSPVAGRIAALHVTEGGRVSAGDLIAELDTALLDAELAQALAEKRVREAQLALLEAGVPQADIAVAEAAVGQAEAASEAARVAMEDARALVTAPGDLDVAIAQAEGQLEIATEQLAAAQANATAADLEQALWERTVRQLEKGFNVPLPGGGTIHVEAPADKLSEARLEWNLASQRTWAAHASVNAAIEAQRAARQRLADLRAQRADPMVLRAQADAAASAYKVAQAAVGTAQAAADVLRAGAQEEQLAAARALVTQAEAAINALLAKRAQTRVTAPQAGTITAQVLHAGEVAASGAPIVRLADLSQVTLTAYVPGPQLGQVSLGQSVAVTVDSFPGRAFEGRVTHIADEAEFTPKNVQTKDERANTVFAVKISLPNSDGALRPGMPADAYFGELPGGPAPTPRVAASDGFPSSIVASGTIEATKVTVSSEVTGRAVSVAAEEGDQVTAGQVLVELDAEELLAQLEQAQAGLAAAQAELARVTSPPQPEKVAQAEAEVKRAEASLQAAQVALESAVDLRANPQELDARINDARGQAKTAAAAVDLARAQLKAAQVQQESLTNPGSDEDKTRRAIYDQKVVAAEAGLRAAQIQERTAQAVLATLLAIRKNPVALDAAVHRAEGQVAQAEAALRVARAALAQVQAPAQAEAVALAQAQVAHAEARQALLRALLDKRTIRSPLTGTVSEQAIHPGEVAQPGRALFTIIDLARPRLVIYVPTDRIGLVRIGQQAEISVDAYPGRTFAGVVTHIAEEAEFTPKNVQTQEERVKTVFAVEIALDNPEGLLRPGMPADARLRPQAD